MSTQPTLKADLTPYVKLVDFGTAENNEKAVTRYKNIGALMRFSSRHEDASSSFESVGLLNIAEQIYDFFTADYFEMTDFLSQKDDLEITKISLGCEMKHLKISQNIQPKILQVLDRHISILNDFSTISYRSFSGKLAIGAGMTLATASYFLANDFNTKDTAFVVGTLLALTGIFLTGSAAYTKSSSDYRPGLHPSPSIYERLFANKFAIEELRA